MMKEKRALNAEERGFSAVKSGAAEMAEMTSSSGDVTLGEAPRTDLGWP